MKNQKIRLLFLLGLFLAGCSDDQEAPATLADFQFLAEDTQVTFNGTLANATSILWDFGDGGTSSEEDPAYIHGNAGTFNVAMTFSGPNGSLSESKEVTILPSFVLLLTGGPARPEGKSWRLKAVFTFGKEGAGPVANGLGILLPYFDNL